MAASSLTSTRRRMLFGPILSVELVTTARRVRYFVTRAAYAAVLLLILLSVYSSERPWRDGATDIQYVARLAQMFFATFSGVQALAIMLIVPAIVVGTIANERERRTLDYLLCSQLSGPEIVLGKLAARLITALLTLLAGIPVLSLTMLMGGISPDLLMMVFATAGSSVVLLGCMSIAVSVWSPRSMDAVMRIYLILFAVWLLPLIASPVLQSLRLFELSAPLELVQRHANPLYLVIQLQSFVYLGESRRAWQLAWEVVTVQAGISGVFVLLAVLAIRRAPRAAAGKASSRGRFEFPRWRPSLAERPVLWKELFVERPGARLGLIARIARILIVATIGFATLLAAWMSMEHNAFWTASREYLVTATTITAIVACGGLLLVAARSACAFTSEKERDCWPSLICTPLTAHEIVLGKLWGNLYALRGAAFLLLFVWGIGVLMDPVMLIPMILTLAALAGVGLFVCSVGLWFSQWCRNSLRAIGATIATCVFAGGGYLFCCLPCIVTLGQGGDDGFMLGLAPCVPFLVAAPGILCHELLEPRGHVWNEEPLVLFTWVLGTVGYFIAGLAITAHNLGSFERLAERQEPRKRPGASRRFAPAHPARIAVPVQQVEVPPTVPTEPVDEPTDSGEAT